MIAAQTRKTRRGASRPQRKPLYSLLDDEWPARRAALLEWLAPGNFDAEGRARAPLRRAGD